MWLKVLCGVTPGDPTERDGLYKRGAAMAVGAMDAACDLATGVKAADAGLPIDVRSNAADGKVRRGSNPDRFAAIVAEISRQKTRGQRVWRPVGIGRAAEIHKNFESGDNLRLDIEAQLIPVVQPCECAPAARIIFVDDILTLRVDELRTVRVVRIKEERRRALLADCERVELDELHVDELGTDFQRHRLPIADKVRGRVGEVVNALYTAGGEDRRARDVFVEAPDDRRPTPPPI